MEIARVGTIVAKRYARKAVLRNKVRRLIRESFRHNKSLLAGLDLVVLLRYELRNPEAIIHVDGCLKRHWRDILTLWKDGSSQ
jgi:ribonuclease P protein component